MERPSARIATWFASAIGALWLAAFAPAATALTIYHSPNDDGATGGVLVLSPGQTATIQLWFDPEGLIFGYNGVFLEADTGIALASFVAEPDVLTNFDPSNPSFPLGVDGGDISAGDSAPRRIGSLVIEVSPAGALGGEIRVSAGTFTNDQFETVPIVVPQLVARVVPEPTTLVLTSLGLLGLAGRGRPGPLARPR